MKRSLRSWLWRVPLDQEVEEELAFHIDMRTRELVERGMDPIAAREVALSRIGDLGQLTRTCEDLGRKRDREMRLTQVHRRGEERHHHCVATDESVAGLHAGASPIATPPVAAPSAS
jgi:hypothetical protein